MNFIFLIILLALFASQAVAAETKEDLRELATAPAPGVVPAWPSSNQKCYALTGKTNPCGSSCAKFKFYCSCSVMYSWSNVQQVCQNCIYGSTCPGNGQIYGMYYYYS